VTPCATSSVDAVAHAVTKSSIQRARTVGTHRPTPTSNVCQLPIAANQAPNRSPSTVKTNQVAAIPQAQGTSSWGDRLRFVRVLRDNASATRVIHSAITPPGSP
jgi:hypothetical protein